MCKCLDLHSYTEEAVNAVNSKLLKFCVIRKADPLEPSVKLFVKVLMKSNACYGSLIDKLLGTYIMFNHSDKLS